MLADVRVGPVVATDGATPTARADKTGALVTTDAHGKYMEAVLRGNVFFAANQAAATFSVGLTTTTAVGLIIANPPGSSKLIVPLQVEFVNTGVIVGVAGISIRGYSATAIAHTTALTVSNALIGSGNAPVGTADSGSALTAAPVVAKLLYSVLSTNTAVISQATVYDLGGSIILPPGTAMAVLASAAITGFASCLWEEVSA